MSEKKVVIPQGMEPSYERLHFAPAIVAGEWLFCSGVIGTRSDMTLATDPAEQFTKAFENLELVLNAGGSSLAEVVEMTTFHVGFNEHIASFMAVKDRFMKPPYPAWTAIGVSELAFGALVEIKVVARIGK